MSLPHSDKSIFLYDRRFVQFTLFGVPILLFASYFFFSSDEVSHHVIHGYVFLSLSVFMLASHFFRCQDLSISEFGLDIEKRFLGFKRAESHVDFKDIQKVELDKKRPSVFYLSLKDGKRIKFTNLMQKERSGDADEGRDEAEVAAKTAVEVISKHSKHIV